jgi:hypothetical protein
MGEVRGYKVFNPDWTCRGFQYEVGKIFEENVEPSCCDRGFHFCEKASDCFSYYPFNSENKVAEIIALGDVDSDETKSCTNKIQIVREIPWDEVLRIVNTGKDCTGTPGTGTPGTATPGTGTPGTGTPGTGTPGTGTPGTGTPGTGTPGTGTPGTGTPGTGTPGTGTPGTGTNHLLILVVSIQKNQKSCCSINRQI